MITKGALICFLAISCFFLINIFSGNISQPQILKLSLTINVIEFLLLIMYCLFYFLQLFLETPEKNLLRSSSFWISAVLLFYASIPIPFFLIADDINRNKNELSIIAYNMHYILISILFLVINRLILWPKTITI